MNVSQNCFTNMQKGVVEILTKDESGSPAAATVKAVVSDNRGKKIGQVPSLEGSQGHYVLRLFDHVSSAGSYRWESS